MILEIERMDILLNRKLVSISSIDSKLGTNSNLY